MTTTYLIDLGVAVYDASEHRERARRSERAAEAASESACRGVPPSPRLRRTPPKL
jgi:hypothetical protein